MSGYWLYCVPSTRVLWYRVTVWARLRPGHLALLGHMRMGVAVFVSQLDIDRDPAT